MSKTSSYNNKADKAQIVGHVNLNQTEEDRKLVQQIREWTGIQSVSDIYRHALTLTAQQYRIRMGAKRDGRKE